MAGFHGVMGEDDSDAECIATLVRRIRAESGLAPVKLKTKGFGGCAAMLRKGARFLEAWVRMGCERVYVCYDADNDPKQPPAARLQAIQMLIKDSGVSIDACPIIPIEELEAWFHADIAKLSELFSWCTCLPQHSSPERIHDPKESLRSLCRHPTTGKYLYRPPLHNPLMAERVDLTQVERLCPAFKPFAEFARR